MSSLTPPESNSCQSLIVELPCQSLIRKLCRDLRRDRLTYLRGAGNPIPSNDVWIAASAMEHGLRVVTTDKHFQEVPQILADCWEPWP